jgi:hypothetical protein
MGMGMGGQRGTGRREEEKWNDASDEEKWGARRLEQENKEEEEELAGLEKGLVKV